MATLTGKVVDIGGGSMYSRQVALVFRLNEPATSTRGLLITTQQKRIVPDEDGYWSVVLEDTDSMHQNRYYILEIEWLNGAPQTDFPVWKLKFPAKTIAFTDLIAQGLAIADEGAVNNLLPWVGSYPDDVPPITGPLWFDPVTGDVYEWSY